MRYIFRRTENLKYVQRFVLGWLMVVVVGGGGLLMQLKALKPYYLADEPKSGGVITEGIVGQVSIINPLFPENTASETATRLIFNGLLRYDARGRLEGDLARQWKVDESGKVYTFQLRPDVKWHDGKSFSSKDALFTFKTIQNSNVDSPLSMGWENIRITAPDENTIIFTLPEAYTPFLDSLTTGILPAHLLGTAEPAQLRQLEFNQRPIGTGPFIFKNFSVLRDEIRFSANENYFHGRPKLDGFIIKNYENDEEMAQAYNSNQITNAAGLSLDEAKKLANNSLLAQLPLATQTFVFLNNDTPLLKDKAIRQALTQATEPIALTSNLGFGYRSARSPLLTEHIGYTPKLTQLEPNLVQSEATLEAAGWKKDATGLRKRDDQPLSFELIAPKKEIHAAIATKLQEQWLRAGIDLKVTLVEQSKLQQSHIQPRNYQMLLYSIPLGADPDQYVYWHSTQAKSTALNLAQYKSTAADQALEAGRTRQTKALRAAKYEAFLTAWREDAPAIALLRLNYFYATRPGVKGLKNLRVANPADLYSNAHEWTINTQPVLKRLSNN